METLTLIGADVILRLFSALLPSSFTSTSCMALNLVPDDFHLSSMETTEDMTQYVSGGYHPVVIGDILTSSHRMGSASEPRQYRIMHKLGFGSYSTVWLAQTADPSRPFVAVKITTAADGHSNEAQILEEVLEEPPNGYPSPHILALLDHFPLHGPNGTHLVLVTEIVVPVLSVLSRKRSPAWRKVVAHGLALGLSYLHAKSVVHGGTPSTSAHYGSLTTFFRLTPRERWACYATTCAL